MGTRCDGRGGYEATSTIDCLQKGEFVTVTEASREEYRPPPVSMRDEEPRWERQIIRSLRLANEAKMRQTRATPFNANKAPNDQP